MIPAVVACAVIAVAAGVVAVVVAKAAVPV
jgi:hypothetical protein